MSQQARISSRINAQLKQQGDAILAEMGLKPSQAITMFYTQLVRQRDLPFSTKIPNKQTIKALNEDLSEKPKFSSVEALMEDLDT